MTSNNTHMTSSINAANSIANFSHEDDLKRQLDDNGYASFNFKSLGFDQNLSPAFEQIRQFALEGNLPTDPYDLSGTRRRQLTSFLWNRDTAEMVMATPQVVRGQAVEPYYQARRYNSESGDYRRLFPALSPQLRTNPALWWLVRRFHAAIPEGALRECQWLSVGVHLVQLRPQVGGSACVTPNYLHRDGEALTFIMLVERHGVTGGVNYVSTVEWAGHQPEEVPASDLLAQATLNQPFDGMAVVDERVAHHVSPVQGVQPGASRTVLLVDFSELIPYRA